MCGYICMKHIFSAIFFCPHSKSHISQLLRHEPQRTPFFALLRSGPWLCVLLFLLPFLRLCPKIFLLQFVNVSPQHFVKLWTQHCDFSLQWRLFFTLFLRLFLLGLSLGTIIKKAKQLTENSLEIEEPSLQVFEKSLNNFKCQRK